MLVGMLSFISFWNDMHSISQCFADDLQCTMNIVILYYCELLVFYYTPMHKYGITDS